MSNEAEIKDLFTVYYMNHSKVYEMRMLLNNKILKREQAKKRRPLQVKRSSMQKEKEKYHSFLNFPGRRTQNWGTKSEQS